MLNYLLVMLMILNTTVGAAEALQERDEKELYPVASADMQGYLQVSERHRLFFATYGNPENPAVLVLHGGPGVGCSDSMTSFFDLTRWYVIMFDQRGAMRSEPVASMEDNSPQHSVEDIERLRKHLGIDQWIVFGGSWGSTLAILYGQAHPDRCLGFILRGVFLGRKQDILHLFYDMGKIFPEAYEPFYHHIPEDERADLVSAYYKRVMDPDPEVHLPAAKAFMKYDAICSTHLPNPVGVDEMIHNDALVLSIARAFIYYAYHSFFLEPNQILANMDKISHIPSILIHGRWDAVCVPEMAYLLHKNWHTSCLWVLPDAGHSSKDPQMAQALAKATDSFIGSASTAL